MLPQHTPLIDCFPDVSDTEKLPATICVADIQRDIESRHAEILAVFSRYFSVETTTSDLCERSRQKVEELFVAIRNIPLHLETFGDLRRIRDNIDALISTAAIGHTRTTGPGMHSSIALDIREKFMQASWSYAGTLRLGRGKTPFRMQSLPASAKPGMVANDAVTGTSLFSPIVAGEDTGTMSNLPMGKNSTTDTQPDCFPDIQNSVTLPLAIPLSDIRKDIESANTAVLSAIVNMFPAGTATSMLVKNRSKVGVLFNEIKKGLGMTNGEINAPDLATFGDLRRTHRKVQRLITLNERANDSRLHPDVHAEVMEQFRVITSRYAQEITDLGLPEVVPANGKNHLPANEEFEEEIKGGVVVESVDPPSWMEGFTEHDEERLVVILTTPSSSKPYNARLQEFFRFSKTRYANDSAARTKLVELIVHSLGNPTSVLNRWLKQVCAEAAAKREEYIHSHHDPSSDLGGFIAGYSRALERRDSVSSQPRPERVVTKSVPSKPVAAPAPGAAALGPVPRPHVMTGPASASLDQAKQAMPVANIPVGNVQAIVKDIVDVSDSTETKNGTDHQAGLESDHAETVVTLSMDSNHTAAGILLEQLDTNRKEGVAALKKCPDAVLRLVGEMIRAQLLEEIERGDSVFGADEIDVAFETELEGLKIWKRYAALQPVQAVVAVAEKKEVHPSMIGFSPEEIVLISKEDRERINTLFTRLSPNATSLSDASEDDASTLADILVLLLKYQDSATVQLQQRLRCSETVVWRIIKKHEFTLLTEEDEAALDALENELQLMQKSKQEFPEDFEDQKAMLQRRIVSYRRLLRMQHPTDATARLLAAAELLDATLNEISRWEYKRFRGLTNGDLAPDLFPSQVVQPEEGGIDPFARPAKTPRASVGVRSGSALNDSFPERTGTVPPNNAFPLFLGAVLGLLSRTPPKKD